MTKKVEILAPINSFPSLTAAIQAGADSVYFGVNQLNMRARSTSKAYNFCLDDLEEIAKQAKEAKIKTYLTINCLIYDYDMEIMRKTLDEAKKHNIDAVIAQDIATIQYANEIGIRVHASTQLSISNFESVKFYSKFVDTVVLARELDLKMIKNIYEKIKEENIKGPNGELVKIEIFVHGALCIAQSGRCQMSILQQNASAQRGACLHECRKQYKITDAETGKEMIIDNEYILSPKDLCTLPFVDQIISAGVSIFKIEGRGKTPDYIYTVTKAYKEASQSVIDNTFTEEKIKNWMDELKKVYNRGFTDGYYLGKALPDFSKTSGSQASEEKIFVGTIKHYYDKAKIAEITVQAADIKTGDKIMIIGNTTGLMYANITDIMENDKTVTTTHKPSLITTPIEQKVRTNDQVYLIKQK